MKINVNIFIKTLIVAFLFSNICFHNNAISDELAITGVNLYSKQRTINNIVTVKNSNKDRVVKRKENYDVNIVWVQVLGSGFGLSPNNNIVTIDNWILPVISSSYNELFCVLPADIPTGSYQLSVTSNNQIAHKNTILHNRTSRPLFTNTTDTIQYSTTAIFGYMIIKSMVGTKPKQINVIQDLSYLEEIKKYNFDNLYNPLNFKMFKVVKKKWNNDDYLNSLSFNQKMDDILTRKKVISANKGDSLNLIILTNGVKKDIDRFIIEIPFRSSDKILELEKPLNTEIKIDDEVVPFEKYAVLSYFNFTVPYDFPDGLISIDAILKPQNNNKSELYLTNKLDLKTENEPAFISNKLFARIQDRMTFFPEENINLNEIPKMLSVIPRQKINIIHHFSVNYIKSMQRKYLCEIKILSTANKEVLFEHTIDSTTKSDGFDSECLIDFFLPFEIKPGKYEIISSIIDMFNKKEVKSEPYKLYVSPYKPSIKMFSWAANPTILPKGINEDDGNFLLLLNSITNSMQGKLVSFITTAKVEGFPPNTKNMYWNLSIDDRKGKKITYTPTKPKLNVNVNGTYRLYKQFILPIELEKGIIDCCVEFCIDNFCSKSKNSLFIN